MMEHTKTIRTDEAWKRLCIRFEQDGLLPVTEEARSAIRRRLYVRWGAVAALVSGVVCCLTWWLMPQQEIATRKLLTQQNNEVSTLVKTLEDGSVVYLTQSSTLQYPEHFDADKREVNLKGDAFFDIARRPQQAFLIETEQVRVEVLGTAFNVKTGEQTPFSLSVKRGKVKVWLKQSGKALYVKAGETATLKENRLLLSATSSLNLFDRYTRNIRFKDECLENVLRVINQESSGVQIETASPALGKKRLTVELSNRSPESVAELICWTFNWKCTQEKGKLILRDTLMGNE